MGSPTCAVCATPCRPPFRAPPAETAPDLDFRPGEPARSSLARWVQTCRTCGASAPDLVHLPADAATTVASPEYKVLTGAGPAPFLRWAMLAERGADTDEAAQALLEAAWATDDAGGDAASLRRRAVTLWGEPATVQDGLRLVDVLRRAGDADAARTRADAMLARPGLDPTDEAVLRYQIALLDAADVNRHLLSSALLPPARTPHVTHGRTPNPPRGFWSRMTRR